MTNSSPFPVDKSFLQTLLQSLGFNLQEQDFECELIQRFSHGKGRLYRILLTSSISTAYNIPISFIVKYTYPIYRPEIDPGYITREIYSYRSRLFAGLNRHVVIPEIYSTYIDENTGCNLICMEDMTNVFSEDWSLLTISNSIRHLAEFHALWWERQADWKSFPFLQVNAQGMYNKIWSTLIKEQCSAIEYHPCRHEILQVFTSNRQRLLTKLSICAEKIYRALRHLPQSILHQDLWLPNMGLKGDKTVIIDWSHVGVGTPGSELTFLGCTLVQTLEDEFDDNLIVNALHTGLSEDWNLHINYDVIIAGYEVGFCLRPAHVLGGPILGGILKGCKTMVGSEKLDQQLLAAEHIFKRIERGIKRVE